MPRPPAPSACPGFRPRRLVPRAGSGHPLRAELLRGVGPWAGAATAFAIGLLLYEKADPDGDWQSYWLDGADLLRIGAVQFGGPIALAAGAWQGGRERRRGTLELRAGAARGPLRQTLVAVAPVVVWPVAAILLGGLTTVLATRPYASAGGPYGSVLVADAVAVAVFGVLGFLAGRLVAWRLAPPLLGMAAWLALVSLQYDQGAEKGSPAVLNPADRIELSAHEPVWWFVPASVLWTGGVGATALLLYAARRRAFALVPLAVAAGGAAVLVQTGEGLWRDSPALSRQVCRGGDPQICLEARNERLRPDVTAALSGLHGRLRGVPGAPVRWTEIPDSRLKPGEAQLPYLDGQVFRGRLQDPVGYAHWAVTGLFGWCAVDRPGWERSADITSAAVQWLFPYERQWKYASPDARRHLARLTAMTPAASRAYLARLLASDPCGAPEQVPAP
ncbi:hypothetical protein ACWDR0_12740 [Streptomyces sp. NPDC003691]